MTAFNAMRLPQALLQALQQMQFHQPTPIQSQAIPPALKGKDILGLAQTGTGKTAAFGIPLVNHLLSDAAGAALVLAPTRELAKQVMDHLRSLLGKHININVALLIGGESMPKQVKQLRRQPRIIVGTPGRINDHLGRKTLTLKAVNFLVLDETDRMLDMGFSAQIKKIVRYVTAKRQTLLFSATMPQSISAIAEKYLQKPVRIRITPKSGPSTQLIKQTEVQVGEEGKYPHLLAELNQHVGSTVIVFVKTQYRADKLARRLAQEGLCVKAIHGGLRQNKRDRVIAAFRQEKCQILVGTDIVARGLDVPHVKYVINYDLPLCADNYVHRIGRTGRAGAKGTAINLIAPNDMRLWKAIQRHLNPDDAKQKQHVGGRRRTQSSKHVPKKVKQTAKYSKQRNKKLSRKRKVAKVQ